MAKKLTMKDLLAAYKELDEQIGVEPPIDEKLSQDDFERELYGVISDPELVTEDDVFTKPTQVVFDALIEKYDNIEEEPEEEDEEEEEEEEPVPAPVKKGKAKPVPVEEDEDDEPEPAPVKKGKSKPVVVEDDDEDDEPDLVKPSKKPVAVKTLPKSKPAPVDEDDEDDEDKSTPVKKGKVKENEKVSSPKKENGTPKKAITRPEAAALAIKQNPKLKSIDEWAVVANNIYEKSGGLSNVSKMRADLKYLACILEKLNIGNLPTK